MLSPVPHITWGRKAFYARSIHALHSALLALLLSAAPPSVHLSHAFEYHAPDQILAVHELRMRQWRPARLSSKLLISATEYLVAFAALANLAAVNWNLGVGTICSFWTDAIIAPTLPRLNSRSSDCGYCDAWKPPLLISTTLCFNDWLAPEILKRNHVHRLHAPFHPRIFQPWLLASPTVFVVFFFSC